jgi:hypothetical protein
MRRFIVGLCCFVVGLQVLIGVPLAVCLAFFLYLGSDVLGPTSVEFRVTNNADQPHSPAPVDQPPEAADHDDAILEARHDRGSLLAGTLLGESLTAADEQREFVAACRQIANEVPDPGLIPANPLPPLPATELVHKPTNDSARAEADRFAIDHLYAMAETDEQVGVFERADQWRALARGIRGEMQREVNATSAACGECLWFAEEQ